MKHFNVTMSVSIALMAGGFIAPPIGVIDGSVLTASGLLLMFAVVERVPEAIRAGRNIKLRKGDSSVEITTEQPLEQPLEQPVEQAGIQ